jgi:class 3 adenylate cyclase
LSVILTGNVVQTNDDFFGTVVNKAARIAALAAPGEIKVSDATRPLAKWSVKRRITALSTRSQCSYRGLKASTLSIGWSKGMNRERTKHCFYRDKFIPSKNILSGSMTV